MSDRDASSGATAQRQQLLARVERDREQLAGTFDELRRPLHRIRRLQKSARAIVPALFAAGLAFLILRALRGSGGRRIGEQQPAARQQATYPVIHVPRRVSWFAMVLQCLSVYRTAKLIGAALRAASDPVAVAPPSAIEPAGPAARSHPIIERHPT